MAQARLVSSAPDSGVPFSLPSTPSLPASGRPSRCCACVRRRSPPRRSGLSTCFPGDVLYAVKCNPEPRVLRAVWAGGVRHFDCASLPRDRAGAPAAAGGRDPFHAPGQGAPGDPCRVSPAWRRSISRSTAATSWRRSCRRRCRSGWSALRRHLGCSCGWRWRRAGRSTTCPASSARRRPRRSTLLRAARPHAARLGICFHVGSQCLDPAAYVRAMALAAEAIARCGVARRHRRCRRRLPGQLPGHRAAAARRLHRRDRGPRRRRSRRRFGYGPSLGGRWSPAAARSSCRCSCAAAMRCTSMTASMAA